MIEIGQIYIDNDDVCATITGITDLGLGEEYITVYYVTDIDEAVHCRFKPKFQAEFTLSK